MASSLGIELRELKKEEAKRLKLNGCVVVSIRRGTIVFATNMQPGFIITSVNGSRVANAGEAIEAIKAARSNVVLDGYYEGEPDLYSYRFKKG